VLEASGALLHARDDRALVGCAAALAWPGPPSSFEWIAYRDPSRFGTRRDVWREPLAHLDAHGAFHSWDPEIRRPACVPATPCPVLIGIRGRNPEALVHGAVETTRRAAREPVDAWVLWATNQASGDHVVRIDRLADAPERATVEVAATVARDAAWQSGGQVDVGLADADGHAFTAVAFPPTGRFRHTVASLRAGDTVTVVGAYREVVVRLEKLHVTSAFRRAAPPVCHGTMKRRGRAVAGRATFKCRRCGRVAEQGDREADDVRVGGSEVAVRARRHLHRPIGWT
jgi:tRNA(Ile2)-agmatinylcytidine synthase